MGNQLRVDASSEVVLDLDYVLRTPELELTRLYEKANHQQWNANDDIDWSIEVDPEKLSTSVAQDLNRHGPPKQLDPKALGELRFHQAVSMISNFLHGEQGALLASAQIVNTIPWTDAKLYAASQVADEARHVDVYRRYLDEKLGVTYPMHRHLASLLDDILSDSRWDITYLGMQILIEGMALAAFGYIRLSMNTEPLIHQITANVMRDEARHVAFGVTSLKGLFEEMSDSEKKEREDFVIEAAHLMHDRLLMDDVWERMGLDAKAWTEWTTRSPMMRSYRAHLFSKIVPNLERLGMLTPRICSAFDKIGILHAASKDGHR